jgi:hypothetical protein
MGWCEANAVDYVFGLARNAWCVPSAASSTRRGRSRSVRTGDKANPRFVVTCLAVSDWAAREL